MEYIGIDVHKRDSQVCVITSKGEVLEQRIRTERKSFAELFSKRTRARILVEASTENEWVARCLEGLGPEVVVGDPNFAPMYAIIPFTDPDLEKLYTFGRYLELKLPQDPKKNPLKLDAETVLAYYRLQKMSEGRIELKAGESSAVYGPTEAGKRRAESETARLSEIIEVLNERFGTQFDKADQLFFDSVVEQAKSDAEVQKRAAANTLDNFSLAMKSKIRDAIIDRMEKNEDIATRYLNDSDFEDAAFKALVRQIYEELKRTAA